MSILSLIGIEDSVTNRNRGRLVVQDGGNSRNRSLDCERAIGDNDGLAWEERICGGRGRTRHNQDGRGHTTSGVALHNGSGHDYASECSSSSRSLLQL